MRKKKRIETVIYMNRMEVGTWKSWSRTVHVAQKKVPKSRQSTQASSLARCVAAFGPLSVSDAPKPQHSLTQTSIPKKAKPPHSPTKRSFMDPRKLSALLSTLVSQILVLLLLLLNSMNSSDFVSDANLFSLINYWMSSQEIVATLSFVSGSKKRKRTRSPESDSEPIDGAGDPKLGRRLSLDRVKLGLTRNPDSFKTCFRMKASTFEWLVGLLEPLLECRDPVGSKLNLSAELRLGIGLSRLATGSSYPEIARRFDVSESVTRFCAKHLCRVLCTNFRFWVAFPNPEELNSVSLSFEKFTGLPNCCGFIESTRFVTVNENNGSSDSIAAQIVVDSSSRILSIVAGFKGDKGDSRVLKCSTFYKDIEEGRLLNSTPVLVNGVAVRQYLVGDGRYPLLPWLMVPFVDVVTGSSEEKFNVAHTAMRVSALKTIASLKNWGVLNKPMEEEFKAAVAIIGACSILHNVLLMREDDSALCDSLVHDQSSRFYQEANSDDDSMGKEAKIIRDALAVEARSDLRSSE